MGHDISGYNPGNVEIAYLRRSMSEPQRAAIYIALGVFNSDYYGGVSGCGKKGYFTKAKIKKALSTIKDLEYMMQCTVKYPYSGGDEEMALYKIQQDAMNMDSEKQFLQDILDKGTADKICILFS